MVFNTKKFDYYSFQYKNNNILAIMAGSFLLESYSFNINLKESQCVMPLITKIILQAISFFGLNVLFIVKLTVSLTTKSKIKMRF